MSGKRLSLILLGSLFTFAACANNDNPIITPAIDISVPTNSQGLPLAINPGSINLEVGKSTKVSSLFTQDGSIKRDLPTTWVSLDPAIASVDSQGNITALKPGSTQIKAQTLGVEASALVTIVPAGSGTPTTPNNPSANPSASPIPCPEGSSEDTCIKNVNPDLAKLRSIIIKPENETVQPAMFKFSRLSETRKFVAEGLDSEGQKIPTLTFSWSSSDEKVSSVNSTGVVTAVATGTSNLIASAGNVTSNIVQLVVQEGTIRAHIRFTE